MPDRQPRIIRNSKNRRCPRCSGVHDYLTRPSDDIQCDAPLALSYERAVKMANMLANGLRDVERIPDNVLVVMDDSARQLPRSGTGTIKLAQFTRTARSA